MKIALKARGSTLMDSLLFALTVLFFLLHARAVAQTVPNRLGDLDADNQPTVLDLQRLLNHLNQTNLLASALAPYGDINEDGLINQADLLLLQNAVLGLTPLPNPYAPPVVNVPTVATNGDAITFTGTARPNRRVLITGGRFAVFVNSDSNGFFTATVQLRPNQVNALFVTASSSNFVAGTPRPLRILQDSQPPNLFIDFPTNGATLYSPSTVVAGRVGDSLSGFMGLTVGIRSTPFPCPVTSKIEMLQPDENEGFAGIGCFPPLCPEVTGSKARTKSGGVSPGGEGQGEDGPFLPAVVDVGLGNNGTYERGNVPLALGTNDITVTATDIHGNSTVRAISVHSESAKQSLAGSS